MFNIRNSFSNIRNPFSNTDRPDSLKTFLDTCKGNFLCLQMISFEFLRVDSIG